MASEKHIPYSDGPHPAMLGGRHRQYRFDNGYGASVIRFPYSYGRPDKWELAVLRFDGPDCDGHLCYSTEVTGDVIGHLSDEDVEKVLGQIKSLPAHKRYSG